MKKLFSILTLFTIFLSPLHSFANAPIKSLEAILECVEYVDDQRLFIKPEKIVLTPYGVGLAMDDQVMIVPEIKEQNGDFFIEHDFVKEPAQGASVRPDVCRVKPILPKGKCPHCNTDTTAWGDCWNPECEYYGKRVI